VVCDHPDHIIGQAGSDFLKIVKTQWDEIKFIGGAPEEYIAMAKRSGDEWFIGIMNNSIKRSVTIDTSFLGEGSYILTYWSDGKNPTDVVKKIITVKASKPIKVNMNSAGGYVAVVRPE
jgi:alpha-glucosidase